MDPQGRLAATRTIWIAFALSMLFLSLTALWTPGGFGLAQVILGVAFVVMSMVSTGFVWNWGEIPTTDATEEMQKSKRRDRLGDMLDNMSDDELDELRHRLMYQNTHRDDVDYDIGTDGELVRRR